MVNRENDGEEREYPRLGSRIESVVILLPIRPGSRVFTLVLGLLAALPALSIDFSAPTLPVLPSALGTSTTIAGLTLSLFMVGFALGQFAGGRPSDRIGRRPVLLGGLAGYALAGIVCASTTSGLELVGARFLQGAAAGTCAVLPLAMVQDLFQGEEARKKRSYIVVILGVVPIFAPSLGSLLSSWAGWRSVHSVLALGGGLLLVVAWLGVMETCRFGPSPMRQHTDGGSGRLLSDRRFTGLMVVNALSYGVIFAYIAGSPIVIIGSMGLSNAVFAGVFACTATALSAGAWTSGFLGRYGLGAASLLGPSLGISAAATLVLAVTALHGAGSGILLLPPLLLTLFARGIIAPNVQHLAIERWQDQAGAASAAIGISQLLSGALASVVVFLLLPAYGAPALAVPMAAMAAVALLLWWRISRMVEGRS